MSKHYDYIITGAGCAGMSLLMRMMQEPFFSDKQILIIDRSQKKENDRTWCFWEKEAGLFESIVTSSWTKANFYAAGFSTTLDLSPYTYKMILGTDLYTWVKNAAATHTNIEWRYENVKNIGTVDKKAFVELGQETLTAGWLFNSILFPGDIPINESRYHLLQHFTGWMIETEKEHFDAGTSTFMDFRIQQDRGASFMYMLPVSTTKALVEYTLFTEKLLAAGEYEKILKEYIADQLDLHDYTVVHKEYGVIPMTNHRFPLQNEKVVYMGTAGGQVKASSGYAFRFIQKRTQDIIETLISGSNSFGSRSFAERKFRLYDSVLLNVLSHHKMPGDKIFSRIFQNNPAAIVLRFLDNESGFWEDLGIMRSVPTNIFLPAAIHELLQRS